MDSNVLDSLGRIQNALWCWLNDGAQGGGVGWEGVSFNNVVATTEFKVTVCMCCRLNHWQRGPHVLLLLSLHSECWKNVQPEAIQIIQAAVLGKISLDSWTNGLRRGKKRFYSSPLNLKWTWAHSVSYPNKTIISSPTLKRHNVNKMYRGSWWHECGAIVFINTPQRKRFFLFVSSGISAPGKARLNWHSCKFRYFVPSEYRSPRLTYVIGTEGIN